MSAAPPPQRLHELAAEADEALQAARDMPPGPQRIEALKAAGKARNVADDYGVIFAQRGRPPK
jgi:hypothetical protein